MTDYPGLPAPPPLGAERAAGGDLRRHVRARHRWRHRSRQGDRDRVRPPRCEHRDREPQGGAPQRREGGDRGARCPRGRHHRRHPRRGADRGDVRRGRVGVPSSRRPHQQRGGQLPGAVRGHVAERVAQRHRHHAERHLPRDPRVRPSPPGRAHTGVDRERRRVVRVDRWPGMGAQRRGQGGREEPGGVVVGRVGPVRHPGERAGARPVPPRGHDRRHPQQPRPRRRAGPQPAGHAGGGVAGAGLGGHVPRVAVRAVHLRVHARGRRRQLAAAQHDQPAGRDHPRPDGPPPVRGLDGRAIRPQ